MKYALLIYDRQGIYEELSEAEAGQVFGEYMALSSRPGVISGEPLEMPDTATTVRVADGQALTTDGPFAESREYLAGFYIVEADDLDGALEVAAAVPAARYGGAVEVRPVSDYSGGEG